MNKAKAKQEEQKKYINHILKNIPAKPGVYKFKDSKGTVLYVGKAVNLKNRISSYFKNQKNASVKTIKLVSQIADVDFTIVDSELEAVLLETNLIKELRPKYNILMKDDKNFVYLKITVNEDYPRILITRRVEKDKALYFGPKTARFKLEKTLKILKKIFPYRHCSLEIKNHGKIQHSKNGRNVTVKKATIKYPCIDYHIKRCGAPCIGLVSPKEYGKIINAVIDFFEGKHDQIRKRLKMDMQQAASAKKFELAASIRDKLSAIEDVMEKQNITAPDHNNLDVINYVCARDSFFFTVFQVRNGKLISQENYQLSTENAESHNQQEVLANFIQQYYEKTTNLPQQILIPGETNKKILFQKWLSEIKGTKVKILVPTRGRKDKLLDLCKKNAENFSGLSEVKWQGHVKSSREEALNECMKLLGTPKPPKRLECYDISHIGGTETVASMVVFENGFPKKEHYRKFKLRKNTPGSPDDYASMKEVLSRRLKYLAPALEADKISVSKPSKNDLQTIFKNIKQDKKHPAVLLKISFGKKIGGHLQIFTDKQQRHLITALKLTSPPHGDHLIKEIALKTARRLNTKKLYLLTDSKNINLYEENGFLQVKKIPDTFTTKKNTTIMVMITSNLTKDSSLKTAPDLIIVDGGKGQLNVAKRELKNYKLNIPTISIAKQNEWIFLLGKQEPVIYPKDHTFLNMIRHIRDESHRFAVSYQQNLKTKSVTESQLDEIFMVGDSTRQKLLKHFGSTKNIKNATLHELEQVIGKQKALLVKKSMSDR